MQITLQNLNESNEVVTFFNGIGQQKLQLRNKIENEVKYLKNLNDVYYKEDKNFTKNLQNLKQSNTEISKDKKVYHSNVKSIDLLEQNNKVINQINQKIAENTKRIKKNLNEVGKLYMFRVELDQKSGQIHDQARQMLENLQQQRIKQGSSSKKFKIFTLLIANESHVSDQCTICMENYEIGRKIVQLDCDGKHTFCKDCIVRWFANHSTCPNCRNNFLE